MARRGTKRRMAWLAGGIGLTVLGLLVVLAQAAVGASALTVTIGDTLAPQAVEVLPGTAVTFKNADAARHRLRTTSGPAEFDTGDLDPGASFTVTLTATGTYQYRDDRNKNLSNYWGTITVTTTPSATATPGGGGGGGGATPAPSSAAVLEVTMAGRAFSPATLTVDAGTTIRFRNNDGREHTASANDRSFDSGIMPVGATFTKVFGTPGTYRYVCLIHPDMTGTIAVRGAGGATPPPPPPPTATPVPTPVTPPAPGSGKVAAVDFAFNPGTIDVVAGTTVTWINQGAALHTVTASDGSFDSGLIPAGGGTFARRFSTPGTYPYICGLHPSMTGVVRVSGANGATPPPAAPPTPPPTTPPVASGELELRDFAFVPSAIRVTPGTTVTWVNTGAAPHTVTDRAGAFNSGILARGARYTRTFAEAGTYQLICAIHPDMHATLVVADVGATAPPPATPAPVATPPPGTGEVAIIDFDFAPKTIEVPVGTTVHWVNQGVAPHTVTARDGTFDSGFLDTGEAFTRTFDQAGVIEYLCAIHPAMVGTIVVGGALAGSGAPGAGASAAPSGDPASSSAGPGPSTDPGAAGLPGTPPGGDGGTAASPLGTSPASAAETLVPIGLGILVLGLIAIMFGLAIESGDTTPRPQGGTR